MFALEVALKGLIGVQSRSDGIFKRDFISCTNIEIIFRPAYSIAINLLASSDVSGMAAGAGCGAAASGRVAARQVRLMHRFTRSRRQVLGGGVAHVHHRVHAAGLHRPIRLDAAARPRPRAMTSSHHTTCWSGRAAARRCAHRGLGCFRLPSTSRRARAGTIPAECRVVPAATRPAPASTSTRTARCAA